MLPPSMLATPTSVKKSSEGASNGNGSSHYDATTVEQIKAQFQAQIEAMMLSQVRDKHCRGLWIYITYFEILGRSCDLSFLTTLTDNQFWGPPILKL